MSKTMRILGIAGSLRHQSYNPAVLRAATQLAPEDASMDIFEIDGIPLYNNYEQEPPTKVVELKRRIREADASLFVTPDYNYSIPGVLNVIDWVLGLSGDNRGRGSPQPSWARLPASLARRGLSTTCGKRWSPSICFPSTSPRR